MRGSGEPPEKVLVITSSDLLCRRMERPLAAAGYEVQRMGAVRELLRSRRQRPFLVCFLDTRGRETAEEASSCFSARPGERYVLVRGAWAGNGAGEGVRGEPPIFGCLREPFAPDEVLLWATRAAAEMSLLRGDRSLDELLYGRFRGFLRELGPSSMTRFHDLVWERVERPLIRAVLEWTEGNQSKAAGILGIHRNTLRAKIRDLGMEAKSAKREGRA